MLKFLRAAVIGSAALGIMLTAVTGTSQPPEPLELMQSIPLPSVRGRIDHMAIDLDGERLFVAALGNDSVEVIDLRAGRRSARVEHLHEPQGVAYVPEVKRLFVANGRSGRVDVFADPDLAPAGHIDDLGDADNIRYDPGTRRIYVGYGSAMAVIDAASSKLVRKLELSGHPESFQLESSGSRLFVNVPEANQVAVIDRTSHSTVATWPLGDMRANFPMALDEPDHRLFVATRRPAALLVYDTESGRRIANLAIGGDADDLFFDDQRKRIYAICGQGVVDVVQQRDPDRYAMLARITTASGARTGFFAPSRNALYVAVPLRGSSAAEIRIYAAR